MAEPSTRPPLRGLIVPGYGDSGPAHWQTLWEQADPAWTRVRQRDWEQVDSAEWVAALDAAVRAAGPQSVLVAHSLGCLAVAQWAALTTTPARAALLVAPPDPLGPAFPASIRGFAALPRTRLRLPSLLVYSEDDAYASAAFARGLAADWGSTPVGIGARGHINAASGLGDWPQGRALLAHLLAGPESRQFGGLESGNTEVGR